MDRVRDAIRVRHCSRRTEETYTHWIRRFIVFHGKRHPDELGNREISLFLALLFLYTEVLQREVGPVDRARQTAGSAARGPVA